MTAAAQPDKDRHIARGALALRRVPVAGLEFDAPWPKFPDRFGPNEGPEQANLLRRAVRPGIHDSMPRAPRGAAGVPERPDTAAAVKEEIPAASQARWCYKKLHGASTIITVSRTQSSGATQPKRDGLYDTASPSWPRARPAGRRIRSRPEKRHDLRAGDIHFQLWAKLRRVRRTVLSRKTDGRFGLAHQHGRHTAIVRVTGSAGIICVSFVSLEGDRADPGGEDWPPDIRSQRALQQLSQFIQANSNRWTRQIMISHLRGHGYGHHCGDHRGSHRRMSE